MKKLTEKDYNLLMIFYSKILKRNHFKCNHAQEPCN